MAPRLDNMIVTFAAQRHGATEAPDQTLTTTLPICALDSRKRVASWICSKGNVRAMTGFSCPEESPFVMKAFARSFENWDLCSKALDQPCSTIDVNRLTRHRLVLHKKYYSLGSFICGHRSGNWVFLCGVDECLRAIPREDMVPHRGIGITGGYGIEANGRKL